MSNLTPEQLTQSDESELDVSVKSQQAKSLGAFEGDITVGEVVTWKQTITGKERTGVVSSWTEKEHRTKGFRGQGLVKVSVFETGSQAEFEEDAFRKKVSVFEGDLIPEQQSVVDESLRNREDSKPLSERMKEGTERARERWKAGEFNSGLANKETGRNDLRIVTGKARKLLDGELSPGEEVRAVIGEGGNFLVATDDRLIVVKKVSVISGGTVSSFNWDDITSIQVDKRTMESMVIVNTTGSGQTKIKNFLPGGNPAKLPNVVPVLRMSLKGFRGDFDWMEARRREGKTPSSPSTSNSTLDELRQLGELRDSGVLTDDEFDSMKTEIIGGNSEAGS